MGHEISAHAYHDQAEQELAESAWSSSYVAQISVCHEFEDIRLLGGWEARRERREGDWTRRRGGAEAGTRREKEAESVADTLVRCAETPRNGQANTPRVCV